MKTRLPTMKRMVPTRFAQTSIPGRKSTEPAMNIAEPMAYLGGGGSAARAFRER
jgi:hypothetical protein